MFQFCVIYFWSFKKNVSFDQQKEQYWSLFVSSFFASTFIEVINAQLCKWLHLEKSLQNTVGISLAHSKFKLSHNFAEFKELFLRQKVLFVRTLYESLLYWGYAQLCKWLHSKFSRGVTQFYVHLKNISISTSGCALCTKQCGSVVWT